MHIIYYMIYFLHFSLTRCICFSFQQKQVMPVFLLWIWILRPSLPSSQLRDQRISIQSGGSVSGPVPVMTHNNCPEPANLGRFRNKTADFFVCVSQVLCVYVYFFVGYKIVVCLWFSKSDKRAHQVFFSNKMQNRYVPMPDFAEDVSELPVWDPKIFEFIFSSRGPTSWVPGWMDVGAYRLVSLVCQFVILKIFVKLLLVSFHLWIFL